MFLSLLQTHQISETLDKETQIKELMRKKYIPELLLFFESQGIVDSEECPLWDIGILRVKNHACYQSLLIQLNLNNIIRWDLLYDNEAFPQTIKDRAYSQQHLRREKSSPENIPSSLQRLESELLERYNSGIRFPLTIKKLSNFLNQKELPEIWEIQLLNENRTLYAEILMFISKGNGKNPEWDKVIDHPSFPQNWRERFCYRPCKKEEIPEGLKKYHIQGKKLELKILLKELLSNKDTSTQIKNFFDITPANQYVGRSIYQKMQRLRELYPAFTVMGLIEEIDQENNTSYKKYFSPDFKEPFSNTYITGRPLGSPSKNHPQLSAHEIEKSTQNIRVKLSRIVVDFSKKIQSIQKSLTDHTEHTKNLEEIQSIIQKILDAIEKNVSLAIEPEQSEKKEKSIDVKKKPNPVNKNSRTTTRKPYFDRALQQNDIERMQEIIQFHINSLVESISLEIIEIKTNADDFLNNFSPDTNETSNVFDTIDEIKILINSVIPEIIETMKLKEQKKDLVENINKDITEIEKKVQTYKDAIIHITEAENVKKEFNLEKLNKLTQSTIDINNVDSILSSISEFLAIIEKFKKSLITVQSVGTLNDPFMEKVSNLEQEIQPLIDKEAELIAIKEKAESIKKSNQDNQGKDKEKKKKNLERKIDTLIQEITKITTTLTKIEKELETWNSFEEILSVAQNLPDVISNINNRLTDVNSLFSEAQEFGLEGKIKEQQNVLQNLKDKKIHELTESIKTLKEFKDTIEQIEGIEKQLTELKNKDIKKIETFMKKAQGGGGIEQADGLINNVKKLLSLDVSDNKEIENKINKATLIIDNFVLGADCINTILESINKIITTIQTISNTIPRVFTQQPPCSITEKINNLTTEVGQLLNQAGGNKTSLEKIQQDFENLDNVIKELAQEFTLIKIEQDIKLDCSCILLDPQFLANKNNTNNTLNTAEQAFQTKEVLEALTIFQSLQIELQNMITYFNGIQQKITELVEKKKTEIHQRSSVHLENIKPILKIERLLTRAKQLQEKIFNIQKNVSTIDIGQGILATEITTIVNRIQKMESRVAAEDQLPRIEDSFCIDFSSTTFENTTIPEFIKTAEDEIETIESLLKEESGIDNLVEEIESIKQNLEKIKQEIEIMVNTKKEEIKTKESTIKNITELCQRSEIEQLINRANNLQETINKVKNNQEVNVGQKELIGQINDLLEKINGLTKKENNPEVFVQQYIESHKKDNLKFENCIFLMNFCLKNNIPFESAKTDFEKVCENKNILIMLQNSSKLGQLTTQLTIHDTIEELLETFL